MKGLNILILLKFSSHLFFSLFLREIRQIYMMVNKLGSSENLEDRQEGQREICYQQSGPLSLVEDYRGFALIGWLSYAIKNQLKASKVALGRNPPY